MLVVATSLAWDEEAVLGQLASRLDGDKVANPRIFSGIPSIAPSASDVAAEVPPNSCSTLNLDARKPAFSGRPEILVGFMHSVHTVTGRTSSFLPHLLRNFLGSSCLFVIHCLSYFFPIGKTYFYSPVSSVSPTPHIRQTPGTYWHSGQSQLYLESVWRTVNLLVEGSLISEIIQNTLQFQDRT